MQDTAGASAPESSGPSSTPVLSGGLSRLVPVGQEHTADLCRIRALPEVLRYWRKPDPASGWPLDDPDVVRFAVVVDEQVVGLIQYSQEDHPDYRHASLDIFLDPAVHGRGVGRDAVATLAAHLVDDHGHHRLVIDPATDNHAAIRCYTAVGFRPVGVMRRYERDAAGNGWHGGLLMDLLAEDLQRGPVVAGPG
ncbi:GNAT family protein [Actinoplanes sp. NEAU-A12]|uniref:GNAT family protein n=1 Tax=Actinoplanes sandaracinus TaxID=3045177 RepID=A0ABT6WYI0_9ACTN|nr:GNAT family protein [Actinoplanes sandaracinus]MDI6104787.1 GNAT family protein [Actinoplanes sandaracinus]